MCHSFRLFPAHFPRMIGAVFLLDEFLVDVRVDLRGADVGVAQQFLQYAQVHARLQAMRGEAVPKRVRRDLLCEMRRMQLHDFPGSHAGHRLPAGI